MIRFAHVFRINKQVEDYSNCFARVLKKKVFSPVLTLTRKNSNPIRISGLKIYNLVEM